MISFSPPRVDDKTIAKVTEVLKSGWITTGPRTLEFEENLAKYVGVPKVLCLSSATAALELLLRWFGVGEGDEVIVPAYTYCATANVVKHVGATPVMVDVSMEDFNILPEKIEEAITHNTKVIIPVDIGGLPCDYDAIMELAEKYKPSFQPRNEKQRQLGRIMIGADAAHSIGAQYKGKMSGILADASVFSFHAVKNLTTAEGGCIAFNFPRGFDVENIHTQLRTSSLHGQNKDALAKTTGNWRYDVLEPGYKCNMTDLQAAIGLVELDRYQETLSKRKRIFDLYTAAFNQYDWAKTPVYQDDDRLSSFHVYMLRIKNVSEQQRDEIISRVVHEGVSVNVHFIPLPMLSYYKEEGYDISDYPNAFQNYQCEISLPVYYDLSLEDAQTVVQVMVKSVETVLT